MTKGSHWLGAGALASFAALFACSGKGAPSGTSGTSGNSGAPPSAACLGQAVSSACYSCIRSDCASQLGSFGNDCSDYIQCYCPNGTFNESAQASQMCVSSITTNPACLSSAQALNTCAEQTCGSACQMASGSSSGGSASSSGSGGGSSGAGSSGGGMTAACGISFANASCASCVTSKCCSATQACGEDQSCLGIITCIHGCNADTSCEDNCVANAPASAQMELNSAASCWESSCTNSGC